MTDLSSGATIPAGTFVVITKGDYSGYHIIGLFRAPRDVVVPGRQREGWPRGEMEPDIATLSLLLDEVPCVEANGE